MFQFARLSLVCPWIQQQFERLTYSGISGSTLIFKSPKHFVAYYALPRLWVPRYPPHMDSSMCSSAPDPEMWIIQGTLAWRTSPVRTGV
ncbi:hypothetical protein PVK06_015504 [Gossypium arboreum]|uniref:Uncharacterized protein n=1 Tax=Gossypium arboreum TaxID=29729 RepID=A0ABR0PXR1_GOSAR|nr:hypothetical protein PVK06_015504 [Gossypium arboreum]